VALAQVRETRAFVERVPAPRLDRCGGSGNRKTKWTVAANWKVVAENLLER